MKAELWIYLQDADQQLQNMKRRHSELELNIAQNMVSQVKVGIKVSPGQVEARRMCACESVLTRSRLRSKNQNNLHGVPEKDRAEISEQKANIQVSCSLFLSKADMV